MDDKHSWAEYSNHPISSGCRPDPRHASECHWTSQVTRKSTELFEIPATIASDHRTNALGDYCARINCMKTAYAKCLGLYINSEDNCTVRVGNGKEIETSESAETTFRFRGESGSYKLKFYLLPNCVHDVILEKSFLKVTQTFSSVANYARRVAKRIVTGLESFNYLYLGDFAPTFKGLLNGVEQQALAYSGSKVLIMDEGYAESLGLPINRRLETQVKLRFADNAVANNSGITRGVRWRFGHGWDGEEFSLDFHILKNAPAAVILNDEFLFGTNTFAEYDCYLTDDDHEDEDAYFFAIDIEDSDASLGMRIYFNRTCLSTDITVLVEGMSYRDTAQHSELVHRGEEEDRIAYISIAQ